MRALRFGFPDAVGARAARQAPKSDGEWCLILACAGVILRYHHHTTVRGYLATMPARVEASRPAPVRVLQPTQRQSMILVTTARRARWRPRDHKIRMLRSLNCPLRTVCFRIGAVRTRSAPLSHGFCPLDFAQTLFCSEQQLLVLLAITKCALNIDPAALALLRLENSTHRSSVRSL